MNEIIVNLVKIVAAILGIVFARYALPAIKAWTEDTRNKEFMNIISIFVEAAEQMFKEPGSGVEKKEYVRDLAIAWINDKSWSESQKETYRILISDFIESMVFEMNKGLE